MNKIRISIPTIGLVFLGAACGNTEKGTPGAGTGTEVSPTVEPGGTTGGGTVAPGPSNTSVAPGATGAVAPGATGAVAPGATGAVTPGATGAVTPGATAGGATGAGATAGGATAGGATAGGATGATGGATGATAGGATGATGMTGTGMTGTVSPDPSTPDPVSPDPSTPDPVSPDPDVPEPSLIVSSNGNFWQVGEVAVVEAGNANFTVNTGSTHQTWHGWGGTFNEAGWDALQELSEADRQRAIELLFDEEDGMGLDWGRIPMGPSDYAIERYTLSDSPGQFSVEHDRQYLIPYIKAAQAVKDDVKYWGSPWTPPPWAKTGGENGGYDKGVFNTEYYEEYAEFFINWIQAYEAEGIPIDHVMPQNEPGWAQAYPTAAFGPARDGNTDISNPVTLGTFVDGHLFPAIDAAGLETDVWYGTLSNNNVFEAYWGDMTSKPSADRIVGAGLQWETIARVGAIADQGYLVMQSEHRCGNYPWGKDPNANIPDYVTHQENQSPNDTAPNDFNYGQESWDLMKSWIDDGVHIYSAWNMVLDTHGTNLDAVRVWNQNALLVVDRDANELIVTPYYYVFRHLTQYVDLEAKRVDINGDALAFQNPDGSVVAVMRTTGAGMQTVSIDGTLLQFEASGNGWVTVNWQGE